MRLTRRPHPIGSEGSPVDPTKKRPSISVDKRGQGQQEELGGDGGEKGEARGVFHKCPVLSVLLYLCQCLKRA